MFRLILIALVGYIAYRVARHWLLSKTDARRVGSERMDRIDDVMVKCPQCGSYFPRRDGIATESPEGERLLCSPKCRDALRDAGAGPHRP
jgi:hypothetical protein